MTQGYLIIRDARFDQPPDPFAVLLRREVFDDAGGGDLPDVGHGAQVVETRLREGGEGSEPPRQRGRGDLAHLPDSERGEQAFQPPRFRLLPTTPAWPV